MITYKDLIDITLDYAGAASGHGDVRYARQAVQYAYREVQQQRRWTWYMHQLRINTVAPQSTGTVAYDHTGGATCERQLTLTGSTWPTTARTGMISIAGIPYEIAEYKSATVLQLSENVNPGADIASGTAYTLYFDTYPLPTDFNALDDLVVMDRSCQLEYVHANEWMLLQQNARSQGTPTNYTIRGNPDYLSNLALSLYPAPDAIFALGGMYNRKPRGLSLDEYSTGTVTATSGSLTVAGNGVVWPTSMIGAIIRFSGDTISVPSGLSGSSPYLLERVIMDVPTSTSITLDAVTGLDLTGVKYAISDPVDMDDVMMDLMRSECFKQLRLARRIEPTPEEPVEYERIKTRAHEADSRSAAPRAESRERWVYPWLRTAITSSTIT